MTIDLSLSDENRLVEQSVRDFAANEIEPHIREWDAKHEVHREVFARMGELGFLGAPIPDEYGGAGMDYVSLGILCEELERADTAFRVVMSVHVGLNSLTLLQWGSADQKERYLVPQARGEKLATFGLTEPGVGTDAASLATTARREGDEYVLNGSKIWISLADIADHFLVFATVDRARKHKGITAFIVERGMPGFTTGSIEGKLGIWAGNTGELAFNDVRVPVANRVGEEGEGYRIALANLEGGRVGIASQSVGMARAAFEAARDYARERESFGKPIIEHQAVAFRLADMATQIAVARQMVHYAAALRDSGKPALVEASMAKLFASEMAEKVCSSALQTLGGYGYLNDFPLERIYRDVRVCQIYEGTSDIQRMVISRNL